MRPAGRRVTVTPARLRLALTLPLVLTLTLGGCGSSTSPDKAQYVRRANAICTAAATQTQPIVKRVMSEAAAVITGGAPAAQRLAGDLRRLQTIAAARLAELRQLRPPAGDRAAVERFLTPLAKVVVSLGSAAGLIAGGQLAQTLALLQRTSPVEENAAAAARAYGLTKCERVLPAVS